MTHREETRSVDSEEGDLIDFGAEQGELGVGGGRERETTVAGRKLVGLIVEEGIPGTESNAESETIGSLNLGIGARLVDAVGVSAVKNLHHKRQH